MHSHLFASQILLSILRFIPWILLLEILSAETLPATGQSVTADGTTQTHITQTGNQIDISGGTIAGENQFHSFDQFGVPSGNTANFQAPQPVENIMGRVTGGNPSVIDGTVKVSGAEANLYLMNPAGMVFGKDAQLDVPGSFNATSATGIGFDNGSEFNATGSNNYDTLVGNPNRFNFDGETGDIVNHGNLAVPAGKNLNLVGDTVESTGSLSAPGGSVNVIAVPGDKNRVRIQQNGMVLQLDVETENGSINSSQLPRYLTGGEGHANTLQVDGNGRVRLTRQTKGTAAIVGTPDQPAQITGDRIQVVGEQVIVDQAILQGATQVLLQSTQGNTTILNTQTIVTPSLQDVVGVGSLLQVLGRQNVEIQNSQLQVRRSQGVLRVQSGHTPSGAITIATPTGAPLEQVLGNTTLTNTEISVVDAQGNQVVGRVEVLADGTIALVGSLVEGQDIFVGGDFQGGGSLPTAQEVFVDETSVVNASTSPLDRSLLPELPDSPIPPLALAGRVIVWADDKTRFLGRLRNPAGFAEVSGKRELDLGQGWVDRLQVGDLLLDPTNITIQAGTVSGIGGSPVTTNTLGAVDIANFLNNTGSLTITTASVGADPGDITVNAGAAIAWNTSNSLTLRADRSINLNPGSSITSTSGDITLIALGQVAGNLNGVNIFGATVESTSGNITMTGRAPDGGDGGWQAGVMIRGDGTTANPALVKSTTGTIILEGTGGNGGGADVGLMVWGASGASALVESQDGSISLTGTGPGGVNFLKHGLYLANGAVRTTGTGNINFAGTPGYPGTYNGGYGLYFDSTSLVEATGSGNITLNSFRDIYINTTTFNLGTGNFTLDATNPILSTLPTTIQFYNSTAQTSGAGSITFDTLQQANIQTSTLRVQDGDITISGNQGTSITPGGYTGVYLAAATLEATGVGNILLQGRTGDSTGNINGVHLNTGSLVKSISGDITLLGQAVGANASATGVLLDYGSAIETQTGAVTLTGSNNGSGASGTGIGMGNGSQIRSTGIGAAAITLDGQMASPASSGRGVVLAHGGTGIFTVDGNVQVTGIGQNWFDVDLDQGVTIRSTGLGNILVQSSNANNSGTSIILYFGANALTATGSGSITVDAARNIDLQGANLSTNTGDLTLRANTAGTATGNFTGLSLNNTQLSSTSGTIALTGQGGETGDNNNGIFVTNTSTIAAPIVSLTGTGGVGGLGNNGIRVSGAGTNILSAGAITLNGTGGSGTLASGSGSGVAANNGLALESSALIEATGTGTITLEGVGGNGVD